MEPASPPQPVPPGPADGSFQVSPEDLAVLAEIEGLDRPRRRTWSGLVLLLVSLALFVSLGATQFKLWDLALLVGVLFFHEAGHFVGMKLFDYQNVKMFFIPFLGAAVSGHKKQAEGYQKAIVALLGPLPGLLAGAAALAVYLLTQNDVAFHVAFVCVLLNAFNLLPIYPLDGGLFLNEVLFRRSRYIEVLFKVLTAATLALVPAYLWINSPSLGLFLLALLGLLVLPSTGQGFRLASLAEELRLYPQVRALVALGYLSPALALVILARVRVAYPRFQGAGALAGLTYAVWERLEARAPGLAATLGLLAIYALAWLCVLILAVAALASSWIVA